MAVNKGLIIAVIVAVPITILAFSNSISLDTQQSDVPYATEPKTAKDCRFTYGKGTTEMFECLERMEQEMELKSEKRAMELKRETMTTEMQKKSQPTDSIDSFEECIAAGNPAMESYPRQCRTSDGKHFVETLPEPKQCEIEGGLWGIWGNQHPAIPSCNPSTSDMGMECTDSSQCQSFCQAKEGSEIDTEDVGMCYGYELAICMQEVRNGVVENEWCQ